VRFFFITQKKRARARTLARHIAWKNSTNSQHQGIVFIGRRLKR